MILEKWLLFHINRAIKTGKGENSDNPLIYLFDSINFIAVMFSIMIMKALRLINSPEAKDGTKG